LIFNVERNQRFILQKPEPLQPPGSP
jgi:hypothetical protein